jgi:hypothetical protein
LPTKKHPTQILGKIEISAGISMKRLCCVLFTVIFPLVACANLHTPLPLTVAPPLAALSSTVFVGYAQASHFVDGNWVPVPEYDYEFLLLERRFAGRWETIKEIHRRHPRYDGRAGPRDQTLYFAVQTFPAADGGLDLAAEGTLGTGKGHEGPGGDGLVIELASAERGWFVPFDTIRIRQTRGPTKGRVEEVVELFSRKEEREIPFMRMYEEGIVYRPIAP